MNAQRSVRRAEPGDAPALAGLLNDALAYKLRHGDGAWGREAFTLERVRARLHGGEVYLVEQEGQCVASMALSWQDETYWGPQEPVAGYVHGLAVRDGHRGSGLGRFAVGWCAQRVAAQGRRWLRLDCDQRNASLCAYYDSLGFTETATRPIPALGGYLACLYQREAG